MHLPIGGGGNGSWEKRVKAIEGTLRSTPASTIGKIGSGDLLRVLPGVWCGVGESVATNPNATTAPDRRFTHIGSYA